MRLVRSSAVALVLWSSSASAQGACKIDYTQPFEVKSALLYTQRHDAATSADDKAKALRSALKAVTDRPGRIDNTVARDYLHGLILMRWFQDNGQQPTLAAKRGDVGYSENADAPFRFVEAIDQVFAGFEKSAPACADSTTRYRNAVFGRLVNSAITFYNAKAYDSATAYAELGLKISPRSPEVLLAYQVMANAAQAAGNLAAMEGVIGRLGSDAPASALKANTTYNLAVLTSDAAEQATGEARTTGARKAAALFKAYLDLAPSGPLAAAAQTGYARAMRNAGDAQAVAGVYDDMLANPARFTALQLFEAGAVQGSAQKWTDAVRLYEAGLRKNPNFRNAIFNLTNAYFALKLPEKMAPLVDQLRGIDPMNADVLKLAAAVWQERGNAATDARAKKMAQDSVRALLDRAAKLPARVTVSEFSVDREGKLAMVGSVENLGAAAATITIDFELLDEAGGVIGQASVSVPAIPPKATATFKPQVVAPKAVAWRYKVR